MQTTEQALEFFKKGYYVGEFKKTKNLEKVIHLIKELANQFNDRNLFKCKYNSVFDLATEPGEFNDLFIEIIKENNILDLLKTLTYQDLVLGSTQLRYVNKRENSYVNWHRDSYFYKTTTGNFPPIYKLIYYPDINGEDTNIMKLIESSTLKYSNNKYIDLLKFFLRPDLIKSIKSSNYKFVIFNTFIFHKALSSKVVSPRLIYSFCTGAQLEFYKGHEVVQNKL